MQKFETKKFCSADGCKEKRSNRTYCNLHAQNLASIHGNSRPAVEGCLRNLSQALKECKTDQSYADHLRKIVTNLADVAGSSDALEVPAFQKDVDIFQFASSDSLAQNWQLLESLNLSNTQSFSVNANNQPAATATLNPALPANPEKGLLQQHPGSDADILSTFPIVDIQVLFSAKEKPPQGYTVIKKSITGHKADLNRGAGGKDIYICYKRASKPHFASVSSQRRNSLTDLSRNSRPRSTPSLDGTFSPVPDRRDKEDRSVNPDLAPITSLSVVFADTHEEPPYGFELITKSVSGQFDADLNSGSGSGRKIFLGIHRGEGPYISDIGVILTEKKEVCPSGYHEVKHTPFGNKADVNSGTDGAAIYLCYRPYIPFALARFQLACASPGMTLTPIEEWFARTLACLTAALYTNNQTTVLAVLDCFKQLPVGAIPAALLNAFITSVCDACTNYLAFFDTDGFTQILKFLAQAFMNLLPLLNLPSCMKIFETCMLLRHEDKKERISRRLLDHLMARVDSCQELDCQCYYDYGRRPPRQGEAKAAQPTSSAAASPRVPAPGDAASPRTGPASPRQAGNNAVSPRPANPASPRSNGGFPSPRHHHNSLSSNNFTGEVPPPNIEDDSSDSNSSDALSPRSMNSPPISEADGKAGTPRESNKNVASGAPHVPVKNLSKLTLPSGLISKDGVFVFPQCAKCKQRSKLKDATPPELIRAIVLSIAGNVALSKTVEPHANKFLRHTYVGKDFRQDITEFVQTYFDDKHTQIYVAITLMCAKYAMEYASFNLKKSEKIKRKAHALQLLLHLLKTSGDFYSGGGVGPAPAMPLSVEELLLRRFICSALVDCCVTDVPSIFRLNLQIFILLWSKFRDDLMVELGVFLDYVFVGLLESPSCTTQQKADILDALLRIFSDPAATINLFYNYDNDHRSSKVFERVLIAARKIIEGDTKNDLKELDASEEALRRLALRFVVTIMYVLAQWIGVPGVRPSRRMSELRQTQPTLVQVVDEEQIWQSAEPDHEDADEAAAASRFLQRTTTGTHSPPGTIHAKKKGFHNTWKDRFEQSVKDGKITQKALELIKEQSSLKAGLKYLRSVNTSTGALPRIIANFLIHQNEFLDKVEVGDVLGAEFDSLMNKNEYEKLRKWYVELIDFTGMTFVAALRAFLCDSGFRLPGEGQKVDRLLEAFGQSYVKDNPGVFHSASSAFILSFAVVMLNTELHDPRLKTGSHPRKPMTVAQFISNLRGVDEGQDFPRAFLTALYQEIQENPIEWQADKLKLAAEQKDQSQELTEKDFLEQEKQFRKHYELLARKAQSILKREAVSQRSYHITKSVLIVRGIEEVAWRPFLDCIVFAAEHSRDVTSLHHCLDGLAYCSTAAIMLKRFEHASEFLKVLAQLRFMEDNRASNSVDISKRMTAQEHLKDSWFSTVEKEAKTKPVVACKSVIDIVKACKSKMTYERHQDQLKQIQSDFGGDLYLVDPGRVCVKKGVLTKVSSNQKRVDYTFFLMNDMLIYASEGINSKYKVHRVVHLSLVRFVDIPNKGGELFLKVVSPQKSFTLVFKDETEKKEWLDQLTRCATEVRQKRLKYLESMGDKHFKRTRSGRSNSDPELGNTITDDSIRVSNSNESVKEHQVLAPNNHSKQGSNTASSQPLGPAQSTLSLDQDAMTNTFSSYDRGADSDAESDDDKEALNEPVEPFITGKPAAPAMETDDYRRRYSTFIGWSEAEALADAVKNKARERQHCKLCIRTFGVFRRQKNVCPYCKDVVCSDCFAQKSLIPGIAAQPQRVCDACYGVLRGMVGNEVPLVTQKE